MNGERRTAGIVPPTQRTGGVAGMPAGGIIQRHLGIREPIKGYGRLIAEMPDGVTKSTRRVAGK